MDGKTFETEDSADMSGSALRAILDIGLLDMRPEYLVPEDKKIRIVDASSDMLVIDISDSGNKYQIGSLVSFKMSYMGALYLLNSWYVEKVVV